MAVIPVMDGTVPQQSSVNPTQDHTPIIVGGVSKGRYTPLVYYKSLPNGLLHYQFSTNIATSDPGPGFLKINNVLPSSATELNISQSSLHSLAVSKLLLTLDNGDLVIIRQKGDPTRTLFYSVTGPVINNATWFTVPVAAESTLSPIDDLAECEINVLSSGASAAVNRLNSVLSLAFNTALAFDATSDTTGEVTLTGNTMPSLVTGVSPGDVVKLIMKQDAVGNHHVNWGNFKTSSDTEPGEAKEQGATSVYRIQVLPDNSQLVTLESTDRPTTKRIILYPSEPLFDNIGGGATRIYDNVVNKLLWTWDDVRKYEYYTYTDLQWSGPQYRQDQKDELNSVKANVPNAKCLAFLRFDLWWMWANTGLQFPEREWGTIVDKDGNVVPLPTAAMGMVPAAPAPAWSVAQAQIEGAGYVMPASYSALTSAGTLITSPYFITLTNNPTGGGPAVNWYAQANKMNFNPQDPNGLAWLDLYTDHIVAQRRLEPNVDGYYISAQKIQSYETNSTLADKFYQWLDGTVNPTWQLATDNLGSAGAGGVNWTDGTLLTGRDQYADINVLNTIVDLFDANRAIIDMLRLKDPGAILVYSPVNFTVTSWRNNTRLANFQASAKIKYAFLNSNAEASVYFEELLSYCASKCDAIEFEADNDASDFSVEWANQMRGMKDKWLLTTRKPQDISLLADQ